MIKKGKERKLTRIEEAIITPAWYLERPDHDYYAIRKEIADILGIELLNKLK